MSLEVLMSCMFQQDDTLVCRTGLTGDVVVINQCDEESYREYTTGGGTVRFFSTKQRGLTKSRNMALENARADVCMLCDDDETFVPDYVQKITQAYETLPEADVVIFKMANRPASFPERVQPLRFPMTMKVSSWQISFRRRALLDAGIRFDPYLGAGTGNGGEEELKFLLDCQRAGLKIYYVPVEIASVAQAESTWFHGFTENFFENRGATTRYILGAWTASLYAVYYAVFKRKLYSATTTPTAALRAMFRGIYYNKIGRQAREHSQEVEQTLLK